MRFLYRNPPKYMRAIKTLDPVLKAARDDHRRAGFCNPAGWLVSRLKQRFI